jgi:hypothetical protein
MEGKIALFLGDQDLDEVMAAINELRQQFNE